MLRCPEIGTDSEAAEQERLEAALRQCTPQMRLRERMVAVAALVQGTSV